MREGGNAVTDLGDDRLVLLLGDGALTQLHLGYLHHLTLKRVLGKEVVTSLARSHSDGMIELIHQYLILARSVRYVFASINSSLL